MIEIEQELNYYILKEFEEQGHDYYFMECWQEVADIVFEFVKHRCELKDIE